MKVTCHLATIPEREQIVKQAISSIANQVDAVYVSLNNYKKIPKEFCGWKNVMFTLTDNKKGDAEKFFHLHNGGDYRLTIDDDLLYPDDYVSKMIEKIEQYERKAVISFHGRTFPSMPIKSYYMGKLAGYPCLGTVEKDVQVHSGGTGVMGWHKSIKVKYDWFKSANMADIWMAVNLRKRNIPIICAEHKSHWLEYLNPTDETIWDKHSQNDDEQTKVFNDVT